MPYNYDTDILAALWTSLEETEEPYASFFIDNPELVNEISEERILSTIELMRSHIELLSSREEARDLHYAITRFLEGIDGINYNTISAPGFSGNVVNPIFPANASFDLTIHPYNSSPETNSITSTSGGDLNTVIGELNTELESINSPIEVYKTVDNRIAFRTIEKNTFVSYTIEEGSGGLLTTAGIVPGKYFSTPKKVAEDKRDNAMNYFVTSKKN